MGAPVALSFVNEQARRLSGVSVRKWQRGAVVRTVTRRTKTLSSIIELI